MTANTLAAALTAALLSSCAASPKDIAPIYVSEALYADFSCEQLREALLNTNTVLNMAAVDQSTARAADASGILLVGLPIASMTGRDRTAQVGILKGHAEAIMRAGSANNCGSLAPKISFE
ncbi:hypothetical protein [Nitratireductor sp. StC3]|uniref:hypothetical protein n=1 Tax=Nitratireductor sp. StC3 TaxID=2126741 RepID=UPI000D0D126A|nr:hypothetical protein [Nitratireductor sp. StC3]PSM18215.1 hypothetical protein C7T96_10110 [Nitratireductor sp. StC3]